MYENSGTLDSNFGGPNMMLTPEDTANLRKAGKWARFLGLVSMVFLGLAILGMIFFGGTLLTATGLGDTPGAATGVVTVMVVVYGLIFAFAFYMVYLLFNFGSKAVDAVDGGNGMAMTHSLSNLGRFFKIYGIITMVYLGFIAIGFLLAIVGGAAAFL